MYFARNPITVCLVSSESKNFPTGLIGNTVAINREEHAINLNQSRCKPTFF
jgi:hypothetical protein